MDYRGIKKNMMATYYKTLELTQKIYPEASSRIDLASASYRDSLFSGLLDFYRSLTKRSGGLKTLKVADIGVGKGWSSSMLAEVFGEVRAFDLEYTISEQLAKNDTKRWQEAFWQEFRANTGNLTYSFFDGYHTDLPSQWADGVTAIAVFEHIGDNAIDNQKRREWLAEVHRILKPGGMLAISECPNRYSYAEWLAGVFKMDRHVKKFTKPELLALFTEAGFRIEKIERTHPFIDFYPQALQGVWNLLYPVFFKWIGKLIGLTPLSLLFHHYRIIAVKE